jgi:hypothetical protein
MCFAALVGALIGLGIGSSAWPLAGTMAALGLAALGLFVRVSRRTGG